MNKHLVPPLVVRGLLLAAFLAASALSVQAPKLQLVEQPLNSECVKRDARQKEKAEGIAQSVVCLRAMCNLVPFKTVRGITFLVGHFQQFGNAVICTAGHLSVKE